MDAAAVAHHRGAVADVLRAVRAGCSDEGVGRRVAEAAGMLRDVGDRDGTDKLLGVLYHLSRDLRDHGYPRLGVDVAITAVALADATTHPELRVRAVQTRLVLAAALRSMSRWEKARAVIDEARSIDESQGCPDHQVTCNRLSAEGDILWDMGRNSEAVSSADQAVSVATRAFGADCHLTALMQSKLGELLRLAGMPSEAVPLLQKALAVLRRECGADSTAAIYARMRLGQAMVRSGDLARGLREMRAVVATCERTEGPNSAHLMQAMCALGDELVKCGDTNFLPEAEAVFRMALGISDRVFGRRHFRTMERLRCLAVALAKQGKVDEAEPLLHRIVSVGSDEGGLAEDVVEHARKKLVDIQTRRLADLSMGATPDAPAETIAHARAALLAGHTPPPACATCGATRRADGRPGDLLGCAACRIVHYCSTACQRRGWREGGHKTSCTRSRVEAKAGPEGRGRPGKGR